MARPPAAPVATLRALLEDARELAQVARGAHDPRAQLAVVCTTDSYRITALQRLRDAARRHRVPAANHLMRMVQTGLFGIELGKDVRLGRGVWFIHPLGIVIGGSSQVGDRVRFFGNNTLGQAKEDGYPTVEDDVWVGAGARVLGPITVGARARIGANAVVLADVPPDHVAVGVPARVLPRAVARPASGRRSTPDA